MATYAIGDIQGCFATLQRLLATIGFDAHDDTLWLCGDLVNRGPGSLQTLRWARDLPDRHVCVLGNHDLHLLRRAFGVSRGKRLDTLDEVLAAPDRDALIDWLMARPFLHHAHGAVLVHAGLMPGWTVTHAETLAREASAALLDDPRATLAYPGLSIDAFTRVRALTPGGVMNHDFDGPLAELPPGHVPWFLARDRASAGTTVLFGHWSALGYVRGPDYVALDTGCVWGRALTAYRLDDGVVFHEPAAETR